MQKLNQQGDSRDPLPDHRYRRTTLLTFGSLPPLLARRMDH